MPSLSPADQEDKFCLEYLDCFDPGEACIRAGIPVANRSEAAIVGGKLLTNANVQKRLRELSTSTSEIDPQHKEFCRQYIQDFNGGAAYIRAGYEVSSAVARTNASRLLKRPDIQTYLRELTGSIALEAELTQTWVLKHLKSRVETTIVDVADISPSGEISIKDLKKLPRHVLGAIQEISNTLDEQGRPQIKLKMKSGDSELRLLAKFTGVDSDWNNWLRVADKYGYEMRQTDYGWVLIHQSKRELFNEAIDVDSEPIE